MRTENKREGERENVNGSMSLNICRQVVVSEGSLFMLNKEMRLLATYSIVKTVL
jgi:hypothetical protein